MVKMIEIKHDDWIFNIDYEKTKKYYDNRPELDRKPSVSKYPDSLLVFFLQCGIDYQKPLDSFTENSAWYDVYGTAETSTKRRYELDFYGVNQTASIVIESEKPFDDAPSFSMWLFY